MTEATFVLFVPKARVATVRAFFAGEPAADVLLREKKVRSGSEFYVSGPVKPARELHERAATWLMRADTQR